MIFYGLCPARGCRVNGVTLAPKMGEKHFSLQLIATDGTTARAPQLSTIHGIDMQLGITAVDDIV
jgi:hypothetical protein